MLTEWPKPYLQPDRMKDCMYYATAYVCRCFGAETTAEEVRQFRAETHFMETIYPREVFGITTLTASARSVDEPDRKPFYMGEHGRPWVESYLGDGWIALAIVHRISDMSHAVVLLEGGNDGVLLMDPIFGHVRETWDWFLGPGPGNRGCHRIEAWYRKPVEEHPC